MNIPKARKLFAMPKGTWGGMSKAQHGLTLLELLICLVILTTTFFVYTQWYMRSLNLSRETQYLSLANLLAQAKMEEFLRDGFTNPIMDLTNFKVSQGFKVSFPEKPESLPLNLAMREEEVPHESPFTWQSTISLPQGDPSLRQIELTIFWKDQGRDKSLQLVTLIASKELTPQASRAKVEPMLPPSPSVEEQKAPEEEMEKKAEPSPQPGGRRRGPH